MRTRDGQRSSSVHSGRTRGGGSTTGYRRCHIDNNIDNYATGRAATRGSVVEDAREDWGRIRQEPVSEGARANRLPLVLVSIFLSSALLCKTSSATVGSSSATDRCVHHVCQALKGPPPVVGSLMSFFGRRFASARAAFV